MSSSTKIQALLLKSVSNSQNNEKFPLQLTETTSFFQKVLKNSGVLLCFFFFLIKDYDSTFTSGN